jgi:hypothetical protein
LTLENPIATSLIYFLSKWQRTNKAKRCYIMLVVFVIVKCVINTYLPLGNHVEKDAWCFGNDDYFLQGRLLTFFPIP